MTLCYPSKTFWSCQHGRGVRNDVCNPWLVHPTCKTVSPTALPEENSNNNLTEIGKHTEVLGQVSNTVLPPLAVDVSTSTETSTQAEPDILRASTNAPLESCNDSDIEEANVNAQLEVTLN